MIDLLYLSHTVVPSHLAELESLGVLEEEEMVLVALDGVLLDSNGRRISGPTLHDYCLLTTMRVLLWARNYGRHLFYAFPLTELCLVEGVGLDPLHAHLQLVFAVPDEDEQRFTFTLLPLADLPAAVTLLRVAADTAQALAAQGVESVDAASEVYGAVSEQIYGAPDNYGAPDKAYRWSGSEAYNSQSSAPSFQQDPSGLPPGKLYSVSRVGRAAWDTVNRALREAEVPFTEMPFSSLSNLSGGDLRNVAETLRALNDLLNTVATNPGAREVAMAFLQRRGGGANGSGGGSENDILSSLTGSGQSSSSKVKTDFEDMTNEEDSSADEAQDSADYHEIPLRRRDGESLRAVKQSAPSSSSGSERQESARSTKQQPKPKQSPASPPLASERGNTIPLRRRGGNQNS
jgi:hypothetical protein